MESIARDDGIRVALLVGRTGDDLSLSVHVGAQFLDWFLKEQREEVASMSELLSIVTRAAESNLLLAEEYLARTTIGDAGDDPSAPAAAGGAL